MRKLVSILACLVLASGCVTLSGCFGIPEDPAVASVVNGEDILEDDVTAYIEGFRESNPEFESDVGWAEYLNDCGYTAESLRTYVLDTNFIPRIIIRQECASRNIVLTDKELDDVIAREKEYYEQRYGENSWNSVLASFGYDEATWRENETDRLLEEQLMSTVITSYDPDTSEIQQSADESAASYSGKHSYYLEFKSVDAAQDAYDDAFEDDEVSRGELADFGELHDAGWSSLSADRGDMSADYIAALDEIEKGELSKPLETDSGALLIFCSDVFSTDEGESVSLASIPAEILEQITNDAAFKKRARLFDEWVDERIEGSDIVYNAMPSELPYDVNVRVGN